MDDTRTYIGRCKNGHRAAFQVAGFANHQPCTDTECIHSMVLTPVRGRVSAVKCGAKCRNSLGPSCSCACGGANHADAHRHH